MYVQTLIQLLHIHETPGYYIYFCSVGKYQQIQVYTLSPSTDKNVWSDQYKWDAVNTY